MALILNIDTSSEVCSVCVADNGIVIAEKNQTEGYKHASGLSALIDEVITGVGCRLSDLSAIALSMGPGSYTGLRIGTSLAKGLCYGLDIPLIGVPTLEGLAYTMSSIQPDPGGLYIPMLDARHGNAYIAIYDAQRNIVAPDKFAAIDVDFWDNLKSYNVKNVYLGGSGAENLKTICSNMEFGIVIENLICEARNINFISYERHKSRIFENLIYFEPFYLKEFSGRMKFE